MAFFESSEALSARMGPLWSAGQADFKASSLPAKPIVGAGGAIGAVAGTLSSFPKTLGVAGFEYYDKSFGQSRGRNFFDYVTRAPVLHTLVGGFGAALLGAALHAAGIAIPRDWGTATSFGAGIATYISSRLFLGWLEVFPARAAGATGRGLTLGRELVEWFKKPLGDELAPIRTREPLPPQ